MHQMRGLGDVCFGRKEDACVRTMSRKKTSNFRNFNEQKTLSIDNRAKFSTVENVVVVAAGIAALQTDTKLRRNISNIKTLNE
jgi:hypothetical protein